VSYTGREGERLRAKGIKGGTRRGPHLGQLKVSTGLAILGIRIECVRTVGVLLFRV
jgi:hypothetical protein